MREKTERAEHREDVDVVVAEAHPEADAVRVDVLRQRMQLVMAVQVDRLLSDDREIVDALDGVGGILLPLPVDPGPDFDEFAEVDLRVEVRRKILAVTAGVDIHDVDRVDLVEVALDGQGAVGIDHARVESGAEDGGHALFPRSGLCASIRSSRTRAAPRKPCPDPRGWPCPYTPRRSRGRPPAPTY